MYRNMSPKMIYCTKDDKCDYKCGRFHKSISAGTTRKIIITSPTKLKSKTIQSLDIPTTSDENNSPTRLSVSNSNEPISPFSIASTTTLDDIIASARRKVSADFQPILLPSPIFLDEDPSSENSNYNSYSKNKKQRIDSDNSLNDVDEIDDEFIKDLMDSDDDNCWFSGDPPSLIIDDDLADFDELLKVTKPPKDHFSNPIERSADPLCKKRKKIVDDDTSSIDLSVSDVGPHETNFFNFSALKISTSNGHPPEYEGNL